MKTICNLLKSKVYKRISLLSLITLISLVSFAQQWNYFYTDYGHIKLGPANNDYAHIYTDKPRFLFDKIIVTVDGSFGSYNTQDIKFNTGVKYYTNGTTRMVISNSTGNVGIGTTSPGELLELYDDDGHYPVLRLNYDDSKLWDLKNSNGLLQFGYGISSTSPKITFDPNGKIGIGIGTGTPNSLLQITGATNTKAMDILGYAKIDSDKGLQFFRSAWGTYGATINISAGSGPRGLRFTWSESGSFSSDLQDLLFLSQTGKVGIGTTSPSAKLTVKGEILCSKVTVVEVGNIPDYVFEQDYNLMQLSEIEVYINEYGHLPGIPSASEVEENGLDLVQMNLDLLKKVEELTLLMIEQKKEIETLKTQLAK